MIKNIGIGSGHVPGVPAGLGRKNLPVTQTHSVGFGHPIVVI